MAVGRVNVSGGNYEDIESVMPLLERNGASNKKLKFIGYTGGNLYVSTNSYLLDRVDQSNPHEPLAQSVDIRLIENIQYYDGKLYSTGGSSKKIYELDPITLEIIRVVDTDFYVSKFHIVGGYLYCSGQGQSLSYYRFLYKYDIENLEVVASKRVIIGADNDTINDVKADENYVYISKKSGIKKFSNTDFSEVGNIDLTGKLLVLKDGFLYSNLSKVNANTMELVGEGNAEIWTEYDDYLFGTIDSVKTLVKINPDNLEQVGIAFNKEHSGYSTVNIATIAVTDKQAFTIDGNDGNSRYAKKTYLDFKGGIK